MKSQESWSLLNFCWFFIFKTLILLSVSDKVCPPDSDEELSVTGQEVSSEITQHLLLLSFSSSALLDQSRPSIPAGQSEGWWVMSCIGLLCGGADAAELQIFSVNREELERASLQGEWQIHSFTPTLIISIIIFLHFLQLRAERWGDKSRFLGCDSVSLFMHLFLCSFSSSLPSFSLSCILSCVFSLHFLLQFLFRSVCCLSSAPSSLQKAMRFLATMTSSLRACTHTHTHSQMHAVTHTHTQS